MPKRPWKILPRSGPYPSRQDSLSPFPPIKESETTLAQATSSLKKESLGEASLSMLHPDTSASISKHESFVSNYTETFSDSSSIALFPQFKFKLQEIASLTKLTAQFREKGPSRPKRSTTVSFLAAVLEIDTLIAITIKQGPDAGKDAALLNIIVAEDQGAIMKMTAWRETAEIMAGLDEINRPMIKKGDIVHFSSESLNNACSPQPTETPARSLQTYYSVMSPPTPKRSSHLRSSSPRMRSVIVLFQLYQQIEG